jgi:hypothetical protein
MARNEAPPIRRAGERLRAVFRSLRAAGERIASTGTGRTALTALVLLAVALPAIHPALSGHLPRADDVLDHLYRLAGLDHAVRLGDLWPRYSPEFMYGYGAPVFNYYSPLSLYPAEILHLIGMPLVRAYMASIVLYTLFGAAGMYLLGRAWGGPVVGLGAAVAYTYAPYTIINWIRRGALAEVAALTMLIWALWAFRRVARRGGRGDAALAAVFFAGLILAHNISAMIGAGLLILYAGLLWWTSPDPPRAFWRLLAAGGLGVGLAAFFWLPAIAETRYVPITKASYTGGFLDVSAYVQPLRALFSPPQTSDLTQWNLDAPYPVGWPQFLLGLLGASLIVRARRTEMDLASWLALAGPVILILIGLMTPAATWLWTHLPLMAYVQFPWRLLGPLNVLLGVLAGAGMALAAARIERPALRAGWLAAATLLSIGYSLPWLYRITLPDPPTESILDLHDYEQETGKIGGMSFAEFTPIWTEQLPDPARLRGLYAQSDVIPRLQPQPEVVVGAATWEPKRADITFEADEPTTLVFDWTYFPGWRAQLDGEPVAVRPEGPHGLAAVDVPGGAHEIAIWFGPTPVRRIALALSGASLIGMAAALRLARIWRTPPARSGDRPPGWAKALPAFGAVAGAGLLAFALKVSVFDQQQTFIRRERFANGVEEGVTTPVQATLGGAIKLLGFDMPERAIRSGGDVPLVVYWTLADGVVDEDLGSVYVLRDVAGNAIQQIVNAYPAGTPTSTWPSGLYVKERVALQIPPGTPPGTYTLQAGIYSPAERRNLDVVDAAGSPIGVLVDLATLVIERPRRPAQPEVDRRLDAALTPALTLVAAAEPPAEAEVGQEVPVVWTWRARRTPEQGVAARLVWLDAGGEVAASSRAVPPVADYPVTEWQRRDVWRGVHLLYVPGGLSAGHYEVAVQLYDASGEPVGERAAIGEMDVTTPERTFETPDMDAEANVAWTNGIRLLGYDLPDTTLRPGGGLSPTLYWQTDEPITRSLTVFLHLIAADGTIAAQRDQIPASGARPTTGWAPGEVVADAYGLRLPDDLPPGTYRLRIGWYDARTGKRVPLVDGDEFWIAPGTITVE